MRTIINVTRNILLVAVLTTAILVGASHASAATLTAGNNYPSTLQSSQQANHLTVFTTPTGVAEGETFTITFASAFDTSSITEDDVDIADDGIDLTTGATCASTEQASVSIASDMVTITICAGDGGAIAAASQVTVEIGTNANSSGIGTNQVTNPTGIGTYFVTIAGTFSDRGSIALPIGGDDSLAVSASIPEPVVEEDEGGGGDGDTDSTAPVISNLSISSITTSTAVVSWRTDELSTSVVNHGVTEMLELDNFVDTASVTSHSMTMTGLLEGQTYYVNANSIDSFGNIGISSTLTFTTLDRTPPVISDIEVIDITYNSARITWTTDEDANSVLSYGLTDTYESTSYDGTYVTSHSLLLTGLTDETEYHFQVVSTDQFSNQSFSDDAAFSTAENLPPANVSGLLIESEVNALSLSWTNPTDEDLDRILVLICEDEYPDGPLDEDCTTGIDSLVEEVVLSSLTPSLTYYIGVFAYDEAGQFASGALGTGLPSASEEELPSEDDDSTEDESDEDTGSGDDPVDEPTDDSGSGDSDEGGGDGDSTGTDGSTDLAVICGDGVCSGSETQTSCPVDCASDSEPTSLGAEEGALSDGDIEYLVADRSISLETTSSGVVEVLPTSTLSVQIPASELSDNVSSIRLSIDGELFLLSLGETSVLYNADVTVSALGGIQKLTVTVYYDDGTDESVSSYLRVVSPGYIYQVIDGEEALVTNANVTLYEVVGGESIVWDGSPYGQFNPLTVNSDGTFYWYVPNGMYEIEVRAEGFETTRTGQLVVTNSIINHRIAVASYERMQRGDSIAKAESEDEEEVAVVGVVEDSSDITPIQAVQESLEVLRDIPGVKEAAEISVPTLAITAGASVVMLSVAFDFLPFLQYLFTAPVLFFWRRRRKSYGVVYNAISKTPVDLAVVRLFQVTAQDEAAGLPGRLVKSRVTDKGGRYFFLVKPGRYRILVSKMGFQFPSEYMAGQKTDGQYLDVYHLEPIEATADNAVISANIPMDPLQQTITQASSSYRKGRILRHTQHVVAFSGVVAAITFAFIRPTPFSIGMIGIQLAVLALAKRLARPRKPISWGVVYDKGTGRPLSRVVTRIFEPKYNKVLETQVTDSKGRYSFMLGPNTYYATFQKEGFDTVEVRPIDYSKLKEPVDFSEEIGLDPSVSTQTSVPPPNT